MRDTYRWLRKAVTAIQGWLPVRRAIHERCIAEALKGHDLLMHQASQRHQAELKTHTKRVAAITKRFLRIDWTQPKGRHYEIRMEFDPRMVEMSCCPQEELAMLARQFACQVEREIATSRFLQVARESERHPLTPPPRHPVTY